MKSLNNICKANFPQVMEGEEVITEQVKEKKRYSAEVAGLKQEKKKDTQKPKSRQVGFKKINRRLQ